MSFFVDPGFARSRSVTAFTPINLLIALIWQPVRRTGGVAADVREARRRQ